MPAVSYTTSWGTIATCRSMASVAGMRRASHIQKCPIKAVIPMQRKQAA